MTFFANSRILNKYDVNYFRCNHCDFVQTEEPYWLAEAYNESINMTDTGLLERNISLSKVSSVIIFKYFNCNSKFLDYAGGYGIFTRLMRDLGFDFYWHDPFTKNLFARGFEFQQESSEQFELLTSFETFEHFVDPVKEIGKMLTISRNILFTTIPLPNPIPKPEDWWYYGLEHGQHISFYSAKTFHYLSRQFHLNFYSLGWVHLLTEKTIKKALPRYLDNSLFLALKLRQIKRKLRSKTFDDMLYLKNKIMSR